MQDCQGRYALILKHDRHQYHSRIYVEKKRIFYVDIMALKGFS